MSIELVMPSNHLILCRPFLLPPSTFPSIRVFSNESVLCIRWPVTGVSALASVLPKNIQDWFPLGSTGWISSQSKGLSRVFKSINSSALSLLHSPTLTSIQGYGFSSGHVWMWELNYKESWAPKNQCFWNVVLEKIFFFNLNLFILIGG